MSRTYPRWELPLLSRIITYCEACGEGLVYSERERDGFDHHYGHHPRQGRRRCPNKRHWWDRHGDTRWVGLVYIPPPPGKVRP